MIVLRKNKWNQQVTLILKKGITPKIAADLQAKEAKSTFTVTHKSFERVLQLLCMIKEGCGLHKIMTLLV